MKERMSAESLDMAICREVYKRRAVTVPMLYRAFPGIGERRLQRAIQRLQRSGYIVVRKVSKSGGPGPRTRYLVMGLKGLRLLGAEGSEGSLSYRKAPRAERILFGNEIGEKLVEAGLPREMLMSRNVALQALRLPSPMTVLDWAIDTPLGLYSVHAKSAHNGKLLWKTIRRSAWGESVRGHIVVCSDSDSAARERRRYLESARRPIVRHLHVVSLEKSDDFRDIVDALTNPRSWRIQIAGAFYSHSPAGIKYSVPSKDESGPITCRIQHEKCGVWMAGDLRTWDLALAYAAREWDPVSATSIHGTDKLVLLVRDFKDARAKAMSLGWREHIWWALAKASSRGSLFCVRNGELVAADSITQGKTQAWRMDLTT